MTFNGSLFKWKKINFLDENRCNKFVELTCKQNAISGATIWNSKPKTNKKRTIFQNYIIHLDRFKDCHIIECTRGDTTNDPKKRRRRVIELLKQKLCPIMEKVWCAHCNFTLQKDYVEVVYYIRMNYALNGNFYHALLKPTTKRIKPNRISDWS